MVYLNQIEYTLLPLYIPRNLILARFELKGTRRLDGGKNVGISKSQLRLLFYGVR